MGIGEMVALFFYILAHNKKTEQFKSIFEEVRKQCLVTLLAFFMLFLNAKKSEPITANCMDSNWGSLKVKKCD